MPRFSVVLTAVAAVFSLALPISAQKFQPKSVQFKGDPEYSDQELLAAAGLTRSAALTGADMNACAKRLMDTGVFNYVAYKFDGVDLVFSLTPDPALLPLRLENLPFTAGPDLDAQLHKRLPLYHGKVPTEGGLLEDVRRAFETMLAAESIKATVVAAPYAGPNDHNRPSAMSFTVTSPAFRLGTIRIAGASMALLPRLHEIVAGAANPLFDSQGTPAGLEKEFTQFYLDQGFAAVKVHAVRSGALVFKSDAVLVPYTVNIQEGRFYKVGSIRVPANALVTQDEADKIVAAPRKLTMGEALPNVVSLIESRYKAKGYLDLRVESQPTFNNSTGTVAYTLAVDPGSVYRVAYVKFAGVSDELRNHLMRQWQLMPGDAFDQTYLDAFLTKAESQDPLLRRSLSGVNPTVETDPDPATHEVNVTFRLEKGELVERALAN
jgi:outer membrane protein assembly factor BamA